MVAPITSGRIGGTPILQSWDVRWPTWTSAAGPYSVSDPLQQGWSEALRPTPFRWTMTFSGRLQSSVAAATAGSALVFGLYGPEAPASEDTPRGVGAPILYLGFNPDALQEAKNLRITTGAPMTLIVPSRQQDQVRHRGTSFDLAGDAGRLAFAQSLGLTPERALALATALASTTDKGRDEAGQLAVQLAEADQGRQTLERLVISGHNTGVGPFGDNNGQLTWATLGAIAAVFPQAARQVEDLVVAACSSGSEVAMGEYQAIFPHLKTIWAYDGSAPGATSGAVVHLARWEKATRGPREVVDRGVAKNTRKAEFVAVWSQRGGYDNGQAPVELAAIRAMYERTKVVVADYLSGREVVTDPQHGPLREHYSIVQRLLGRNDLPATERPALEKQRDQLIRLLFFGHVRESFVATHGATLRAAFASLGLPVPNLARMTRIEALRAITEFQVALRQAERPGAEALASERLLVNGLVNLERTVVPDTWV